MAVFKPDPAAVIADRAVVAAQAGVALGHHWLSGRLHEHHGSRTLEGIYPVEVANGAIAGAVRLERDLGADCPCQHENES
jgi:hypothetical protein